MKVHRLLLALSVLGTFVVTGCSGPAAVPMPSPELPAGFPEHSVEEILDRLDLTAPQIRTLDTRTSLSVVTEEMTENVTAVIRFDLDSAMYASIRATILNAEVGRSLVTKDSFYVYNRIERELTYGPVYLADRYIPISGSLGEIHALLTGSFNPQRSSEWSVGVAADKYILSNGLRHETYEVDPRIWRVTHYLRENGKGELLDERIFDDYADFDGIVLPRRLILRQPYLNRTVALYHRSIHPNPETQDFDIDVDRSQVKSVLIDR